MKREVKEQIELLEYLFKLYPDSPATRVKKMLKNGLIKCNGKIITSHSYKLRPGDKVEISTHEEKKESVSRLIPYDVLYEDNNVIVIDKPAGISTSSTDNSPNVFSTLKDELKRKTFGRLRVFVVHRLDKEVSGVLLFAKSKKATDYFKDNWSSVEKKYYALVEGIPEEPEGVIRSWLKEDNFQKVYSTSNPHDAKYAVTHYKILKEIEGNALLEVKIETGRKNQIRVHLSDIGCSIVGDRKYGASDEFIRRVRLHAFYLSFPDPVTGKIISVESPMPKGFLSLKDRNEHYK
jgi:RluA family pseudouridine synthase